MLNVGYKSLINGLERMSGESTGLTCKLNYGCKAYEYLVKGIRNGFDSRLHSKKVYSNTPTNKQTN